MGATIMSLVRRLMVRESVLQASPPSVMMIMPIQFAMSLKPNASPRRVSRSNILPILQALMLGGVVGVSLRHDGLCTVRHLRVTAAWPAAFPALAAGGLCFPRIEPSLDVEAEGVASRQPPHGTTSAPIPFPRSPPHTAPRTRVVRSRKVITGVNVAGKETIMRARTTVQGARAMAGGMGGEGATTDVIILLTSHTNPRFLPTAFLRGPWCRRAGRILSGGGGVLALEATRAIAVAVVWRGATASDCVNMAMGANVNSTQPLAF